ncbi:hypothetical protein GCM10025873_01720 [Demequina sediminis]|nr:hypothetical protein GCM10025873_01720 [Demequina sediminis]
MPHTRGELSDCCAMTIAGPIPVSTLPRYSPSTAPRNAAGTAICSAVRIAGAAAMMRTLRSCVKREPPYTATTSRLALSADLRPSSAPTTVVKNTDNPARNTAVPEGSPGFGGPRISRMMGPIATIGMQ